MGDAEESSCTVMAALPPEFRVNDDEASLSAVDRRRMFSRALCHSNNATKNRLQYGELGFS